MSLHLQIINSLGSGLIAGVVVAFLAPWLSSRWSRRNWQLQEAMKAFAGMLHAGNREISVCQNIKLGAAIDDDELIQKGFDELGGRVNSRFLQLLGECWLLERDSGIRAMIDNLEQSYGEYRLHVRKCAEDRELEKRLQETNDPQLRKNLKRRLEQKYNGMNGDQLLNKLKELRNSVAGKYFHGKRHCMKKLLRLTCRKAT